MDMEQRPRCSLLLASGRFIASAKPFYPAPSNNIAYRTSIP